MTGHVAPEYPITFIQTQEGWLYLATMIDLFNRQVVGWQVSTRIDQVLVNDALNSALLTRGKPSGVIVHTDRGSQGVFNRSSQHLIVEQILSNCPVLRPVSSNQAFYGAWN